MVEAYVYRVTNKLTGEFYYGYRYRNKTLGIIPENDIWVKYFTSSNRIKKDIKQYGSESFTVEILYKDTDSLKCWQQEQITIKSQWGNPLLLNGKYHDPDSNVEVFRRVNLLTEKSRLKMSLSGKGRPKSEEHKRKIAIANTGNVGSTQKREKIAAARRGKPATNKGKSPPKYLCIHCGSMVSNGNLKRWHGDNCKSIDPQGHAVRSLQVASINKKV